MKLRLGREGYVKVSEPILQDGCPSLQQTGGHQKSALFCAGTGCTLDLGVPDGPSTTGAGTATSTHLIQRGCGHITLPPGSRPCPSPGWGTVAAVIGQGGGHVTRVQDGAPVSGNRHPEEGEESLQKAGSVGTVPPAHAHFPISFRLRSTKHER